MDWSVVFAQQESLLGSFAPIAKVCIGLGFIIFIHELGHFLVAKACGVKCEKFYVGFDVPIGRGRFKLPASLIKFQWGETEYGVGIIPLGGYVKMLGQDDNPNAAEEEAERIRVTQVNEETGEEEEVLDPRSYPAKSIPARMAIISAGVIMNMVSAIFLAAGAFVLGVNIQPTVVGSVRPGTNAWINNWQPGSQVIQLGEDGNENDYLRWTWDMKMAVVESALDGESLFVKRRLPDGTIVEDSVMPKLMDPDEIASAAIGVGMPTAARIPAGGGSSFAALQGEDVAKSLDTEYEILKVDDIEVVKDQLSDNGVGMGFHVKHLLNEKLDQTVTLTLAKVGEDGSTDSSQIKTIDLVPTMYRSTGIICEMGPIGAIQKGSIAQRLGMEEGDVITSINGESGLDPATLQQYLRRLAGQSLTITVMRGDAPVTFEVEELPTEICEQFIYTRDMVGLESIGVAVELSNVIASVVPGSSAAAKGVKAGDLMTSASFVILDEFVSEVGESKTVSLGSNLNEGTYSDVVSLIHSGLVDTDAVAITVMRDKQSQEFSLSTADSKTVFYPKRGINLMMLERFHAVDSWSAATAMGWAQVKYDMTRVVRTLRMLFTGKASVKNLGGPVTIFRVANNQAKDGWSKLLLFLCFISANLAILNVLPIPALDGGHLMFLSIEAVTRKPPSEYVQGIATMIGVLLLLGLMVFVIFNDVVRWVAG